MVKKSILLSFILSGILMLSGCAEQNHPPSEVEDPNPNSERIYGEKDGPPRQTANTYQADPASVQKADALRQKLFPK
ncbi:MAG: hypothetical protein RH860_04345 [Cytophagales bacterium]